MLNYIIGSLQATKGGDNGSSYASNANRENGANKGADNANRLRHFAQDSAAKQCG